MKEKKPWYVRLKKLEMRNKEASISVFVISVILVAALSGAITYHISIAEPMQLYEEVYDMEFNIYANGILEDIADKVINENNGINIQNIPAIVSEYNIKYAEQRIEFNYVLDNSQVISDYYSKTGKKPYNETSQRNLEMNIQISKELQKIEKTSFLDNLPTREGYQVGYMLALRYDALLCGCWCALLYITLWFFALKILYEISEKWERKHELS